VLPCYLDGAFRAWPKGSRFPRPRKVRLVIGAPRNYAAVLPDKTSSAAIAAELRAAVQELAQQHAGR
jgi:1-acyl-sn-glycerol-3-phosphate acyltransferase